MAVTPARDWFTNKREMHDDVKARAEAGSDEVKEKRTEISL
jgi:hypothetical protein